MKLAQDIIKAPVLTEKSYDLIPSKKYTFEVAKDANKIDIKNAVEKLFDVKVVKVTTRNIRGKIKKQGRYEGKRPDKKKAIVTLQDGDKIQVFEGL